MKLFATSITAAAAALMFTSTFLVSPSDALSLTVRNDVPGNATSPIHYGLMYEDINRCGDSGIYGQMLRNWNFQADDAGAEPSVEFWSAVGDGATIEIDADNGLNDINSNSLRLEVSESSTGRAGVSNEGWWGVRVQPGETYQASFFAKADGYTGNLNVTLESTDGTVLASASTSESVSNEFQKFEVTLDSADVSDVSIDNSFVVSVDSAQAAGASIYFQVFTLFGETFEGRENGLRKDLADSMKALNPKFFRFPGGNNLEGQYIDQRWKWNETVGPLEERIGRMGDWSYWNTNGQGLLDYMYMCEDFEMEPIVDVYAGYSLQGDSVPEDELGPFVQEALNELEYLTGSTETTYGALRASHGREEPFQVNYIQIGNEDWFSDTYDYRYRAYYDAISEKYPDAKIIATADQESRPWDIFDDHYYYNITEMIDVFSKYDNYDRNGTYIFIGEYGTHINGCCDGSPTNLEAGIGDAIFLTGMERNADIVIMVAYAPLLKREGQEQWNPDMIHFDTEKAWFTPSYYVFQEWSKSHADTILQVDHTDGEFGPLYWVAGSNKEKNQVYIKVANIGDTEQSVKINLQSLAVNTEGTARIITGDSPDLENTKESTVVKTEESTFTLNSESDFEYTFAALSATVLILDIQQ
ncbi:glycoside hydrolase superfamily [Zychaea mexicana]|uniref:glycoside hydrolase superfamily n=1 Tax=Zychaea mexicana TaxID=64656 RepID=UPI0022FE2DC3|nr:glycoside hydrolase superfamily [Zychaea mexicana]KAI9492335.1 glycoside hydrolase superfamily [Zychaea mexicana]